eukprot:TRINITY_DN22913_c0_g1_i4.p1 TRINITY_DN22913_c0_g1~~TRINITY_DN22913_c0_g1_i4.p1  ORF type:complete len:131 (+),score=36.90 TRINITY_DN22913_c0_g1_i4:137-529(+)
MCIRDRYMGKRYRRSLIAIVTESGEAPQRKLTNFNYEFIINSCASGEEGSKLLVRMKISSVDCSGKIHNTAFELSLPDFYELYHELKKAKNMIDMMAQFFSYFLEKKKKKKKKKKKIFQKTQHKPKKTIR